MGLFKPSSQATKDNESINSATILVVPSESPLSKPNIKKSNKSAPTKVFNDENLRCLSLLSENQFLKIWARRLFLFFHICFFVAIACGLGYVFYNKDIFGFRSMKSTHTLSAIETEQSPFISKPVQNEDSGLDNSENKKSGSPIELLKSGDLKLPKSGDLKLPKETPAETLKQKIAKVNKDIEEKKPEITKHCVFERIYYRYGSRDSVVHDLEHRYSAIVRNGSRECLLFAHDVTDQNKCQASYPVDLDIYMGLIPETGFVTKNIFGLSRLRACEPVQIPDFVGPTIISKCGKFDSYLVLGVRYRYRFPESAIFEPKRIYKRRRSLRASREVELEWENDFDSSNTKLFDVKKTHQN